MEKEQKASNYFKNSFNCSQSVFAVFASDYGISENDSLKIACAFGGGMGRQQHTCGAVTGALMVLGLKFGKGVNGNNSQKTETYAKTVDFMNEFIKRNGSVNCKELLQGLDMNYPEEYQIIEQKNLFETSCVKYVSDATEIVEKMIEE